MSDSRLGSASLASALLSGQQDVAEWCNAVVASHGDESSSLDAHKSMSSCSMGCLSRERCCFLGPTGLLSAAT